MPRTKETARMTSTSIIYMSPCMCSTSAKYVKGRSQYRSPRMSISSLKYDKGRDERKDNEEDEDEQEEEEEDGDDDEEEEVVEEVEDKEGEEIQPKMFSYKRPNLGPTRPNRGLPDKHGYVIVYVCVSVCVLIRRYGDKK